MKLNLISCALTALALASSGAVSAQDRLYDNSFPLSDVTLLDSPFRHAMDLNVDVLLQYDTVRLLAPYL